MKATGHLLYYNNANRQVKCVNNTMYYCTLNNPGLFQFNNMLLTYGAIFKMSYVLHFTADKMGQQHLLTL